MDPGRDAMSFYEKVLAGLITGFLIFWAGVATGAWIVESIAVRAERAAAEASAGAIAKIKIHNTTVNAKVVERIRTEQVYRECKHSPEAFQTLLQAYQ